MGRVRLRRSPFHAGYMRKESTNRKMMCHERRVMASKAEKVDAYIWNNEKTTASAEMAAAHGPLP